ncbi:MAG: cytochrome P450 [Hyphomonadaceae bacterium]|nr:cytochrome P450 [Hyphomonadaceae bacterium]
MKLDIPLAPKPSHVPSGLVVNFDLFAFDANDGECQLKMKEALQGEGVPDVFWTPCNGGHWVAARGQAVEKVLTTPETFSSRQFMVVKDMNPDPPLVPLMLDPPEHTTYRNLLMHAFSPPAVQKLGEKARRLAIELIEGFKDAGECEFIGDFATRLPVAVFMSMVDWPESDRERLLEIAELVVRPSSMEAAIAGRDRVDEYAREVVESRRNKLGDDLISDLLRANVGGGPIPDHVLNGMVKLLLTAGLDTVASSMGFQARHLAGDRALRRRLADSPGEIPQLIEELLRRYPIGNLGRVVAHDISFFGAELKAGDAVFVPTLAYGLDDRLYEHPEAVELDRTNRFHLSFGAGPHRCIGSMLARTELRIFVEEWLKRVPDFSIKPGHDVWAMAGYVIGIRELPLVWTPK